MYPRTSVRKNKILGRRPLTEIPLPIFSTFSRFSYQSNDLVTFGLIALTATGFIWVRYSFVITPVNYSLAAASIRHTCSTYSRKADTFYHQVNLFVGATGLGQLGRIYKYVLPFFLIDDLLFTPFKATDIIHLRAKRPWQQNKRTTTS